MLLTYEADKDLREDRQWAPLHGACQGGHIEVVEELLLADDDLTKLADDDTSCPYITAYEGHTEVWMCDRVYDVICYL